MGPEMTLLEPVGKTPEASLLAGFVPRLSEDIVARQLLRPLFDDERETLLLAGFDAFERLVRLERAEGDATGRCVILPRCWRALLDGGIAAVVMAHNHPSGTPWPSDADIATTHEAALFLRTMDIELVDHLIFVTDGHFSFRAAQMM
jgi:DNA repair protein RadC